MEVSSSYINIFVDHLKADEPYWLKPVRLGVNILSTDFQTFPLGDVGVTPPGHAELVHCDVQHSCSLCLSNYTLQSTFSSRGLSFPHMHLHYPK